MRALSSWTFRCGCTCQVSEPTTSGPASDVTVRHLLTHTGGFEGDIWAATTSGDDALQRFVDDLVARAPQHSRPGELFSYCSAGYGVLGRLVEVLRQTTYAGALRHYLAGPLGIQELAFCADEALLFRTAIGHGRPSPEAPQRPLKAWAVMPPSNPAAGNQLAMSARGLIAFARMHLADGLAPDGTRLLSKASARAMRERQIDHPAAIGAPKGQGLGWMLSASTRVVEHGGDTIGVASMLRMVPESGVASRGPDQRRGRLGRSSTNCIDPLLGDLAAIPPALPLPAPDAGARVARAPAVSRPLPDPSNRPRSDARRGWSALAHLVLAQRSAEPGRNRRRTEQPGTARTPTGRWRYLRPHRPFRRRRTSR